MHSAELRNRFLKFFVAQKHTERPSDGLIPSGDPTVLFTSAGMNQFKDYFLGKQTDLTRAASCQKCLRTGDLERVGKPASHHSFFEMLGNFSFGDYFKREAILWAWEFLTGTLDFAGTPSPHQKTLCLSLPKEKLWVSIYEEDEEAFALWRKLGVPENRIKRFGQADNFWPANAPKEGPNGPCGPCSEIYFDPDGAVHGPKSVEVWNLVFTQFDRQPDGSLKPLPKPNIDTGMGLERLTCVIQNKASDYETDLFEPIIYRIKQHFLGGGPKERDLSSIWMIADHLRAIVFLLAEKLHPSNEKQGYVLRMLIRRAHWTAGLLLHNRAPSPDTIPEREPYLADMAKAVITTYASVYPKVKENKRFILETIKLEEERFGETLAAGNEHITQELERLKREKRHTISGEFAFKMKDTYGYPLELLRDIADRHQFTIEESVFEKFMSEQRERSRAGSQFGGDVFVSDALEIRSAITGLLPKDEQFAGYQTPPPQLDVAIKGLWDGTRWVDRAVAGQTVGIVLDRSPFYGEAGGQVGDTGTIEGSRGCAEVNQTTWVDDVLVHQATIREGALGVSEPVRALVDPEHRLKVARSHTATHLLHWALRKVLGPDAVQAGSYVDVERVRFDFSSLQPLHEEQRHEVEALVNRRVRLVDDVHTNQMRVEEAKQAGALALFGEKYSSKVRVVTIGDYSKELCGGTHVAHTGFVGSFLITAESSIAAGTRRVEALVGEAAAETQRRQQHLLHDAAKRLGRPADEVVQGLEELLEQLKQSERERKALQGELAKVEASRLVAEGKKINGVTFVTSTIKHADRDLLATMADAVKRSLDRDGIVLLASSDGPAHVAMVMATTSNLTSRVHAGQLLKAIAPLTQGSGGGRPEFAQAGGKDPSGIPTAMKRAEELVRQALEQ